MNWPIFLFLGFSRLLDIFRLTSLPCPSSVWYRFSATYSLSGAFFACVTCYQTASRIPLSHELKHAAKLASYACIFDISGSRWSAAFFAQENRVITSRAGRKWPRATFSCTRKDPFAKAHSFQFRPRSCHQKKRP